MDLRVEVSSIAGPAAARSQDFILNKRESENTLVVEDGEIAVIGGLLDENERRTIEKIPLLGDLPVIGNLFRSRGRERNKTNLMIFIRPTIVRSPAEQRAVAARRYDYIRDQQQAQNPLREPTLDELVPRLHGNGAAEHAGRAAPRRGAGGPDAIAGCRRGGAGGRGRARARGRCARRRCRCRCRAMGGGHVSGSGADEDRPGTGSRARTSDVVVEPAIDAASEPAQMPVRIPYAFARKHGVVLVGSTNGHLKVAMREGADPTALIELRRWLARPFAMEFVAPEAFDRLLGDNYAMSGEAAAANAGDLGIGEDLGHLAEDLSSEDLLDTSDNAPAIRLINGLIADAARQGVSDIHIEPYETGLVVRMRKDGVLQEALRLPPHVAPVVVSRIKVMARLDIAERRLPQDGRIGLTLGGKLIDVRVSTLPSRRASGWCCVSWTRRMPASTSTCSACGRTSIPPIARRWASRTGSCWSPGRPDRARPRRFMPG
jgi:hypothetical protein